MGKLDAKMVDKLKNFRFKKMKAECETKTK